MIENKNILLEADEVTSGGRQEDYGSPEKSFGSIAGLWNAYLISLSRDGELVEIGPADVARMMVLLKIARQSNRPKRDNLVDIAGYARTEEMLGET